jgi:hypothetical protein
LITSSTAKPSHDADLRVHLQLPPGADAQERVQQAAVADVDLRRLHLPLAKVFEPRRQLPDHEYAGQQVHVAADGTMKTEHAMLGIHGAMITRLRPGRADFPRLTSPLA